MVSDFEKETPKDVWIHEFIVLRSKAYAFKCNVEKTNKLKGNSKTQSRDIRFEE